MPGTKEHRSSELDAITHNIVVTLFDIVGRLRGYFSSVAAEFDLSPPQARALRWLQNPTPMGELAEVLHCDPSNVTGITDRLERRGLVTRMPGEEDRRVKQLVLTEDGRQLRERFLARLYRTPLLTGLDEEDQIQLRDLLHRVLAETPGNSRFSMHKDGHP